MNRLHYAAVVALLSSLALLVTAHPVFWLALMLSSAYAGYTGMELRFGDAAEV